MNVASLLDPVLADVARAAGLVTEGGDLDPTWFENPLKRLESVLTDASQRAAVLDLLDQIAPPALVPGAPQNQKWHPLLGSPPAGNVYLTVDDSADPQIVIGIGAQYASSGGPPGASVLVEFPIAALSGTSFSVVAGTAAGPLSVTLAVTLGWTTPAHPIALAGVSAALLLAPAANPPIADVKIALAGLDLDGTGAQDVVLDPQQLGGEATRLVLGLVREQLEEISGTATGAAAALAEHLIPLLGLDGSLPAFPLAQVAGDPAAITTWLRSLLAGSPAPMQAWLGHLAGLLGVTAPTVLATTAAGGAAWSAPVFTQGASSFGLQVAATTAADGVTPQLSLGLTFALLPAGPSPPARFDAEVTVLTLPLAGSTPAAPVPSASLTVAAPGDPAQRLIAPGGSFSVDSLRAGLRWNGSSLAPLLEMDNVLIGATPYPVIDLTNANTAISAGISAAISSALGSTGAGAHLAALAGVVEPAADPAAPLVDPLQLAAHPTRAIATLHRNALLSAAHPWSNYFGELTALLGLPGPVTGTGTLASPWAAEISSSGALTLSLVAWNAQESGHPADPQQLRIGLRVAAAPAAVEAAVSAELFGVDLQASGPSQVAVLGGYHASVHATPGPPAAASGVSLSATSIDAEFDLAVGDPPVTSASITGLSLASPGGAINVPKIDFPFPGGFDLANPAATLGISVTDLEKLVLGLAGHALAGPGSSGLALAALAGCTSGVPGLPADFPVLGDPGGPGSLFGDPLAALGAWLGAVATGRSADGTDFATPLAVWLAGLLAQALPSGPASAPDPSVLSGSGSYDDPWLLPLGAADSAATGLAWIEPAGPPSTAALAGQAISSATDFPTLVAALGAASRYLPQIPPSVEASALASGLQALSAHLQSTDGVVPVSSQIPAGGSWTAGTPIGAPHHLQPSDASARGQILAQVNTWAAPGSPRAILLLGPAFSDHTIWAALLADAEAANPGTTSAAATFNLRVAGVAPASVDLRAVTAIADYYTADLQDDGSGDVAGLAAQIGLVQARLAALKPGAELILVAHSTAGLAARAYTEANPASVHGLITLGTPHAGAPLVPLTDPVTGDALRAYAHLFPAGVAAGPMQDALQHLLRALDGYLPPASPGGLPVPSPYPVGDFAGAPSTDTAGVPALALGGPLGGPAGVDLMSGLQAAAAAALSAFTAAAPTHFAFGARVALPLGAATPVDASATVRIDAGRVALGSGVAEPARPAHSLSVSLALSQPGGWLVGGPLSFAGPSQPAADIRVRSLQLGLSADLAGQQLAATPSAALHEASYHGTTSDVVGWADARLQPLLGSVFAAVSPAAPPAATSLGALLAALQALGIAAVDAQEAVGLSADAVNALSVDPVGYLAPKVTAALASLGFTAAAPDSLTLGLGTLPLELFAQTSPAAVGLRTTAAGPGLGLATGVSLAFSVGLPLATMTPAVTAALSAGPATLAYAGGALTLTIPPDLPSLPLFPAPPAASMKAALTAVLPGFLLSTAAPALLEPLLGPGFTVSGLASLLSSPGQWLVRDDALGNGTVLDPAKINRLLAAIGTLPAGLTLSATGTNPTTLGLATSAPLGGVLDLSLSVSIDATRHLAPAGTFAVVAPLGGTWPSVTVTVGVTPSGVSLTVTPGGGTPVELLPTFSGAGALAGAAEALLPQALDALRTAVPAGPLTPLALDVAAALDLYDGAGGFAAHAAQLAALTSGGWIAALPAAARTGFLAAVSAVFNDPSSPLHGAIPGTISASGTTISWSFPVGGGSLGIVTGWDASGPTISFTAADVNPGGSPLTLSLAAGYAGGALALDGAAGISLQDSLGISVVPQLALTIGGDGTDLALLPLGGGEASTLAVTLLPSPGVTAAAGAAAALVEGYAIPLVADLLIGATGTDFTKTLWSSGPTIEHVLAAANLITIGPGPAPQKYSLHTPLPDVATIFAGLLQAITPVTVPLASSPPLSLAFVDDSSRLGVRLLGSIPLTSADPQVSVLLGAPATWLGPDAGITLYLFTLTGGLAFAPALDVRGLGLGLSGPGDAPLLAASGFRVGAVDAYLAFDLDMVAGHVSGLGGGVEIDQLGLPITQFDSASASNPVAASLLDSNGSSGGDNSSVNPAVDVIAYDLDGSFTIEFAGASGPVVIPVHASFGPVYLDQIDLAVSGANAVTLGIDGDVKIAGLDVSVIELALSVPLPYLLAPDHWSLDLQGLAVAYSESPVEITGGLRKSPGPPIEYDGMISVSISDIGLTAVGSYARPSDAQGPYTSLFIFVSVGAPLGGPPFAFVIGLGGGFGYNRELNVPADLNAIDSFVLVSAIDDSSLANDPMGALLQMGTSIPPSRGAFWIAAGVRLTTFALINTTMVVAIALDRGFEIDVLGISRMALPTEDAALVSVELALKARYNSEEGVLSVQAQLTDNSYIFSHDCQLTGGFAFFAWFPQGQFVLTLGGYNPAFTKPPQFPSVPRLGFNWSVSDAIVVKGGCYFALTDSCVMAGGSLSATASFGPVSAWFDAYLDFLVSWDPFAYEFDIGVEIGASLSIQVCFFACVTIGVTVSLGAQLAIAGPPFHGTASISYYVTTISVSFGDPPAPPPYITDWNVFAGKYLTAGDPNQSAVSIQFNTGVLTPDPPGAQPAPGSAAQPQPVGVEFSFTTTARMPATSTTDFVFGSSAVPIAGVGALDIAPMDLIGVGSAHTLTLEQQQEDGSWRAPALDDGPDHFTITAAVGPFPEATWRWTDPQHLPAAARTISAVAGLKVDAHVVLNDPSELIPISTLVADLPQYALPLPFATTVIVSPTLQEYGAAADSLAATVATASSRQMVTASVAVLSGAGVFAQNRAAFGLPPGGLGPLATQALQRSRSAPPLVAPITTGLTMEPVGLPAPRLAEQLPPVSPVLLQQPRLRAMLQTSPQPAADAPPSLHTSVTTLQVSGLPRTRPPAPLAVPGARLLTVPAAAATRPTGAALRPRAIRNADLGAATGAAQQQALTTAGGALTGAGVTLGAGAAHLWDLPQDAGSFSFTGDGGVRMICTDRSGAILADAEFPAAGSSGRAVPAGTEMVAIQALGAPPAGTTISGSGFGAITAAWAPAGQAPAVGWQAASTLLQIGPSRFAARGATVHLPRAYAARRNGQRASYGTVAAGDAVAGQPGVETQLPAAVSVVIIALDVADPAAAPGGDLALGFTGGTLATPPQRVAAGQRRLLFYDVASREAGATSFTVSVASARAWTVGAVIGMAGTAIELASALQGGIPDRFVPDGPISPGGSVTATYAPGAPA